MLQDELKRLLEKVRAGEVSTEDAFGKLQDLPFADLGFAAVDNHRALRTGFPEVILCEGKLSSEVVGIAAHMAARGSSVLGTRCTAETFEQVQAKLPSATFNERARTFKQAHKAPPVIRGRVAVVTAGTSDIPVAEEANETLQAFGTPVRTLYDVGVAGIHRLLGQRDQLQECDILIVVAGMEGALASVVAGVCGKPTIAVPTSVGYGASFKGVAALLGMLNSCAMGVTTVNIDNGFGAAAAASLLLRQLRGVES